MLRAACSAPAKVVAQLKRWAKMNQHSQSQPPVENLKDVKLDSAPLIGCGVGGCLLPILLFLFCVIVLKDAGGPLFWPIIAVPLGLIGLGVGYGVRSYKNRKK